MLGAFSSASWWVMTWPGRARPLMIRSRRCVVYRRSCVRPNPTVTPLLNSAAQGGCRVGGGEHAGDAQPPGGVDQAGQVVDHLAGILAAWMTPVPGLEAHGVD